jgi:hypothetical protein
MVIDLSGSVFDGDDCTLADLGVTPEYAEEDDYDPADFGLPLTGGGPSDAELANRVRSIGYELATGLENRAEAIELSRAFGFDLRQIDLARSAIDYGQAPDARDNGLPSAGGYELADGYGDDLREIDLAVNAQMDREMTRVAEDGAEAGRRGGTEVRLGRAYDRIAAGTYTPGGAFEMASPTEAGRQLAALRWRQNQADPVTGGHPCGHVDETGRCGARYHEMGCPGLATPDIAEAVRPQMRAITAAPVIDAHGRTWSNQYGTPLDITQAVEAASGQRLVNLDPGGFESGHGSRDVFTAARQARYGDYDDPDDAGADMPRTTRALASAALTQMGVTVPDATRERDQARTRRDAQVASHVQRGRLPERADQRWDTGTRRERLHQPVTPAQLRQVEEPLDGLPGAVPMYTLAP